MRIGAIDFRTGESIGDFIERFVNEGGSISVIHDIELRIDFSVIRIPRRISWQME